VVRQHHVRHSTSFPGSLGSHSRPAGMLTVAFGQLVVARSSRLDPKITMQPDGRFALTGFNRFPSQ
jgi:hypothetical protein